MLWQCSTVLMKDFKHFKNGGLTFEIKPGTGQPSDADYDTELQGWGKPDQHSYFQMSYDYQMIAYWEHYIISLKT